jgi:hypothetical protein
METLIDELPPVSRPTELSKSGANHNKGRKIVYTTYHIYDISRLRVNTVVM